jgi:hypothetical protein
MTGRFYYIITYFKNKNVWNTILVKRLKELSMNPFKK